MNGPRKFDYPIINVTALGVLTREFDCPRCLRHVPPGFQHSTDCVSTAPIDVFFACDGCGERFTLDDVLDEPGQACLCINNALLGSTRQPVWRIFWPDPKPWTGADIAEFLVTTCHLERARGWLDHQPGWIDDQLATCTACGFIHRVEHRWPDGSFRLVEHVANGSRCPNPEVRDALF